MRFRLAQLSMLIAVLATLSSCLGIWSHLSDTRYLEHAKFHMSRELILNLALLAIISYVMFINNKLHTPAGWVVMSIATILLAGAYWLGLLITAASTPSFGAGVSHVLNTSFGLLALVLSYKHFQGDTK